MVAGVYFSLQGSFGYNGVGKIKISYSRNIRKHISKIKGYNGDGLSLVRMIVTKDYVVLKRKLCARFENFRRNMGHLLGGRNWFNLTREQINDACSVYEDEEETSDGQYTVEDIIGHQGCANTREYLTVWGDGSDPSWQPQNNFFSESKGKIYITECLKRYWISHPYLRVYFDQSSSSAEESNSEDFSSEDLDIYSSNEESVDDDYENSSSSQESDSEELDPELKIYD